MSWGVPGRAGSCRAALGGRSAGLGALLGLLTNLGPRLGWFNAADQGSERDRGSEKCGAILLNTTMVRWQAQEDAQER